MLHSIPMYSRNDHPLSHATEAGEINTFLKTRKISKQELGVTVCIIQDDSQGIMFNQQHFSCFSVPKEMMHFAINSLKST